MTEKYKYKNISEVEKYDWWEDFLKQEREKNRRWKNGKTDSNTKVRQSDRDTL